ncbi:Serine/threonine-protein kinase PrkC [Streptomyces sp. YIM 130001]|uniref:serine/threonine-protein kinase n=1 Tax=Streptomyces sp. YIM 130001 TaxID=2259644 RepID=UPI000E6493AF|nr:serine/threonine-protein kinase [Streptomyces sp. YIM 130001]RII07966.1 Serine/threonine-protein kinase PrkC [Streptomyces sp. YIM 130001]
MTNHAFAGRYVLADEIGRGGAGAVWRAWDHRRHTYVAVKLLQRHKAQDLLRFVREQSVRIDHPHVVAPATWAAEDDQVLFTMDLVAGGSLESLVGDYGPLPPRLACLLIDQLLAGLEAVHAETIVHRDIKPANILLEATGTGRPHLRLSDFGLAWRKGEPRLTHTHQIVGTPGFIAPELLDGDDPHAAADVFNVGVVALFLLQGTAPDTKQLVREFDHARGVPPAPAGIDDRLWQALGPLLHPDPALRIQSAAQARSRIADTAAYLPAVDHHTEPIDVFDQLGPLPGGFGPDGPTPPADLPPPPVEPNTPELDPTPPESKTTTYHLAPPQPTTRHPDGHERRGPDPRIPGAPAHPPSPEQDPIGPEKTVGAPARLVLLAVVVAAVAAGLWALALIGT